MPHTSHEPSQMQCYQIYVIILRIVNNLVQHYLIRNLPELPVEKLCCLDQHYSLHIVKQVFVMLTVSKVHGFEMFLIKKVIIYDKLTSYQSHFSNVEIPPKYILAYGSVIKNDQQFWAGLEPQSRVIEILLKSRKLVTMTLPSS